MAEGHRISNRAERIDWIRQKRRRRKRFVNCVNCGVDVNIDNTMFDGKCPCCGNKIFKFK